MIVDVKIDYTVEERVVATGCKASDPEGNTQTGVFSRETARLALTYAVLNDFKIMTDDIQNT